MTGILIKPRETESSITRPDPTRPDPTSLLSSAFHYSQITRQLGIKEQMSCFILQPLLYAINKMRQKGSVNKNLYCFSFFVRFFFFSNIHSSKLFLPWWPVQPHHHHHHHLHHHPPPPPPSSSSSISLMNPSAVNSPSHHVQPSLLLYDQNNHVSCETTTRKKTTIKTQN